jgi:hypothetical protein
MQVRVPKNTKQLKIDKSNSTVLAVIAVATAIIVFCLFSYKALLAQGSYQRRVVNEKHNTVEQLKENIETSKTLSSQFATFDSANPNAIGGKSNVPANSPPPDGSNSRIVLDALPTSYDFAALLSSLNQVLELNGIGNKTIGQVSQTEDDSAEPQADPQPATIQSIPLGGEANYGRIQNLVKDLERSTRPFDVMTLELTGFNSQMTVSMTLNTYFQPAKGVVLEQKEVE